MYVICIFFCTLILLPHREYLRRNGGESQKKEIIQSTLLLIIMVVCVKIFYTYLWWHCSFLTIKFVAVFFSLFMSEFFFSFFPPFAFFLVFFVSAFLKKWISLPFFPKLFKVLLSLIEQKYPHWFFSFFYLSSSFCFKVYDYLGNYYSFHPLAQPI